MSRRSFCLIRGPLPSCRGRRSPWQREAQHTERARDHTLVSIFNRSGLMYKASGEARSLSVSRDDERSNCGEVMRSLLLRILAN